MTTETTVQTLPEAPVSATVKVAWRGYDVLYTTRGHTGGEVLVALDKAMTWFEEHGGKPAPHGNAGTNGHGHAAPATNGNGQAATGDAAGVTDAEWVTVNVPKDGKIRVEFWRTGREYAEENVVRTAEALAPLLESIGLSTTPGEHKPLPVRVHWTRGRERLNKDGTPSGKHYHDVTRLELLPPA